jgi:hypothetical protein
MQLYRSKLGRRTILFIAGALLIVGCEDEAAKYDAMTECFEQCGKIHKQATDECPPREGDTEQAGWDCIKKASAMKSECGCACDPSNKALCSKVKK